jgi:hypothetical protein
VNVGLDFNGENQEGLLTCFNFDTVFQLFRSHFFGCGPSGFDLWNGHAYSMPAGRSARLFLKRLVDVHVAGLWPSVCARSLLKVLAVDPLERSRKSELGVPGGSLLASGRVERIELWKNFA